MKNYYMRLVLKYIGILAFFIGFCLVEAHYFSVMGSECTSFSEFQITYFELAIEYQYTGLIAPTLHLMPVLVFLFLYGSTFYMDWHADHLYTLLRYQSRKQCFFNRVVKLILAAVLFSILFIVMLAVIYFWTGAKFHMEDCSYSLIWLCVFMALLTAISLLSGVLSLRFGSAYGILGAAVYWMAGIKVSLWCFQFGSWQEEILKYVLLPTNILQIIVRQEATISNLIAAAAQIAIMMLVSYIYISRADIGLCNKESE